MQGCGPPGTEFDTPAVKMKCVPGAQKQSLGYICSNSQKYIIWVKIINFSFMPKIIRILSKDHVP